MPSLLHWLPRYSSECNDLLAIHHPKLCDYTHPTISDTLNGRFSPDDIKCIQRDAACDVNQIISQTHKDGQSILLLLDVCPELLPTSQIDTLIRPVRSHYNQETLDIIWWRGQRMGSAWKGEKKPMQRQGPAIISQLSSVITIDDLHILENVLRIFCSNVRSSYLLTHTLSLPMRSHPTSLSHTLYSVRSKRKFHSLIATSNVSSFPTLLPIHFRTRSIENGRRASITVGQEARITLHLSCSHKWKGINLMITSFVPFPSSSTQVH